jgi:hypothetical protein
MLGSATNLLSETMKGTNNTEDKLNKIQKNKKSEELQDTSLYARFHVFFMEVRG